MRIAISGKLCSGKDTLAAALGLPRYAFADGVKKEVIGILAQHGIDITLQELEKNKQAFRTILQAYGTDLIRNHVDQDYWVNRLIQNIKTEEAVITDVRFPNEAAALQSAGFVLVRLECREAVRIERYSALYNRVPTADQLTHLSETALDNYVGFDEVINSDTYSSEEIAYTLSLAYADKARLVLSI